MGPNSDGPPYSFMSSVVLPAASVDGLPLKHACVVAPTFMVPRRKLNRPRHNVTTLLPAQHCLSPTVTIYLTGPRTRCLMPPRVTFLCRAHMSPVSRRATASLLLVSLPFTMLCPIMVWNMVWKLTLEREKN